VLSREVLLDVRIAYATISSEESHRVAAGSIAGSSQRNQASAFVSNVPNRNNFQINNHNAIHLLGFTDEQMVTLVGKYKTEGQSTAKLKIEVLPA
ncbi:hypothetical protein Tco_0746728, partial [Tanacetum coccineum]